MACFSSGGEDGDEENRSFHFARIGGFGDKESGAATVVARLPGVDVEGESEIGGRNGDSVFTERELSGE